MVEEKGDEDCEMNGEVRDEWGGKARIDSGAREAEKLREKVQEPRGPFDACR